MTKSSNQFQNRDQRRRLNARCKDEYSKIDPEATVGYLHRTVRAFISKQTSGLGFLMQQASLRPARASGYGTRITPQNTTYELIGKFNPERICVLYERSGKFLGKVIDCILIINDVDGNSKQPRSNTAPLGRSQRYCRQDCDQGRLELR
jgi:hypothetical protein